MSVPDHTLRLSYSSKRDKYTASYQEGSTFTKGSGEVPEQAISDLLREARREDREMEVRMFLSKIFEPWLRILAREHGVPLDAPNLEVSKSKIITPGEYIMEK